MNCTDYKYGLPQEDLAEIQLSFDQKSALKAISDWQKNPDKPYFVLAGGAGTGKSTLLRYIAEELGVRKDLVLFCTLTGKAALVLRRKGVPASTIHSSIYEVNIRIEDEKEIIDFRKKSNIFYDLIIVDEASMITQEIFRDLLSFGKPIIFVGDSYQLPPIKDTFNIMEKPDFLIKEVLRQCLESPILRLAYMAKEGNYIPVGHYGEGIEVLLEKNLKNDDIINAGQIIVGKNDLRNRINEQYRAQCGYVGHPRKDEKLIILSNNPAKNAFNGQLIYLNRDSVVKKKFYQIEYVDEYEYLDSYFAVTADIKKANVVFVSPTKTFKASKNYSVLTVDYGYAITCHKSQGSQFDDVLVYGSFYSWDKELKSRWMYTAITRAVSTLKIIHL